MGDQAVVDLIMALTGQLSAVADEFTEQARRIVVDQGSGRTVGLAATAGRLLAERRRRTRYLPENLFDEPAWNMLLALIVACLENHPMNMKQLIAAADVPVTTAQRWVDQLARAGLIQRTVDPDDRRRVEITLSERGEDAMRRYLQDLHPHDDK